MNAWNNTLGRAVRYTVAPVALALLAAGCPDTKYDALQQQVLDQREQIQGLEKRLANQNETIKVLRVQIAEKTGVTQEELEQLFGLSGLTIEAMSGGYDTDKKAGDEGVVLYVQPVDIYGDVVKAPGKIEVTLYDLDQPSGNVVYQNYIFETQHLLEELWYGRMWTYHYTLKCPWPPSGPPASSKLTARVVFTHRLTGQRLEAQKVVDITLPLPTEDADEPREKSAPDAAAAS